MDQKSLPPVPHWFILMQMRIPNTGNLIGPKGTVLIGPNGAALTGQQGCWWGNSCAAGSWRGGNLSPIGWNRMGGQGRRASGQFSAGCPHQAQGAWGAPGSNGCWALLLHLGRVSLWESLCPGVSLLGVRANICRLPGLPPGSPL